MKSNFLKISILAILLIVSNTGCKKYLDVNTNPNFAQDAPVEMLLPAAQIYIGSAIGVDLQINAGLWAQYWTQSPASSQYKIFEQYSPSASNYNRVWSLLYSDALENLSLIEKKGTALGQFQYVGVAKILKAYSLQILTDAFGDIPNTDALKGQPIDGGIVSPAYDKQTVVYDSIIHLLQDGTTLLNNFSDDISGDLIYKGKTANWVTFANTLQLKVWLRMSEKYPAKSQLGVQNLYAAAAGDFIQTGGDAMINYFSTSGNQNPLYSEMVGLAKTQNLVASKTIIDSMVASGDKRVTYLFKPTTGTNYIGLAQGYYTASSSTAVSIPSFHVGADANDVNSALAPVKLISAYESMLLQAEASARGWSGASDDNALFDAAVIESFNACGGLTPSAAYLASYWGTYPNSGTQSDKLRHIITQKWFAMCGTQNFESWCEWRRTNYPTFFKYSVNSIIGNKFPRRFFYPDDEVQRNSKFPGQVLITGTVDWDIH